MTATNIHKRHLCRSTGPAFLTRAHPGVSETSSLSNDRAPVRFPHTSYGARRSLVRCLRTPDSLHTTEKYFAEYLCVCGEQALCSFSCGSQNPSLLLAHAKPFVLVCCTGGCPFTFLFILTHNLERRSHSLRTIQTKIQEILSPPPF